MTQLEEIKAQLAELTTKVESLNENEGEYTFTKKQLEAFITAIMDGFIEDIRSDIKDMNFDEDVVELELDYNRTIQVTIDSNEIARAVNDEIDFDVNELPIDEFYNDAKA